MAEKSQHMMQVLSQKFSKYTEGYFFPSDDIPQEEKGDEWCLAWQQAIWALFMKGSCYSTIQAYDYIQLLRLYGAGRQPNGIYMDLLLSQASSTPVNGAPGAAQARAGWLSTNWEIFSPAPKLHREVRGRFEKQEFDYVANAVDPTSQAEREDKKWEVWYDSQYGDEERKVMQKIGQDIKEQTRYIAESLEELEMFKNMGGIKLKKEAEIETVLDMTDYLSDIKTIKQKIIDDLVDFGKGAFRDYYDTVSGLVKYEYIDWENLIIDYSNETDFKDIRFWSYLKFETINNVRAKTGLSEQEVVDLAQMNCGMWGNMQLAMFNKYRSFGWKAENGVKVYDQFRVPIMVSEWISTDKTYKVKVNMKRGGSKYFDQKYGEVYNTEKKKTRITEINNVYQSTWIMGSKYVYDNGISLNTARPDPKNPKLSIHAIAIPGNSIIESVKILLDQIELAWVRLQSAIATAAPNGYDYDLDQLENVSIGGKNLDVMELIDLQRQTGNSIRRSGGAPGNPRYQNMGKPINHNEGGVGSFMQEIVQVLELSFRMLYELTGVDLVSAASAQGGETTATQVKYAAAATSDALQPLYTSWVQMKEDAAVVAAYKIQRAISKNPTSREAYEGILGKTGAEILSIGSEKSPAQFGIKLEVRSNAEMKAAAIEAATKAMEPGKDGGGIDLPDWYYFVNAINRGRTKQAMALLQYRQDRNKKEALKLQRENMQLNGQNMMQQEKAKQETTAMKIGLQGQVDMKLEAEKALLTMQVNEHSDLGALKLQLIQSILQPPSTGGESGTPPTEPAAQPAEQAA